MRFDVRRCEELQDIAVSWAPLRQATICQYSCSCDAETKAQGCIENLVRAWGCDYGTRPSWLKQDRLSIRPLLGRLLLTAEIFRPTREIKMKDAHSKAAEHHESAAKSHRAAADSHGRNDHTKGKEHATQAQQHAQNANEHSKTANAKSAQQK
jgi:hypothetical protein